MIGRVLGDGISARVAIFRSVLSKVIGIIPRSQVQQLRFHVDTGENKLRPEAL